MTCRRILLINPNSSVATTQMMVGIAQAAAGASVVVVGVKAEHAPPMIVSPEALTAAADEVVHLALANQHGYDAIIVAAFGDPGLDRVRACASVPAVGIAEAAMVEAAEGGRRFGVATTTPALVATINARADELGLAGRFTGVRVTDGDPGALVANPKRLKAALAKVVAACIIHDRAQAVIIGGGPLARAAIALQPGFTVPIVAPIPAAVRNLLRLSLCR